MYLDADKVMAHGSLEHSQKYCIKVKCYERFLFWICPHPDDLEACEEARLHYGKRYYLSCESRWISADQLAEFVDE